MKTRFRVMILLIITLALGVMIGLMFSQSQKQVAAVPTPPSPVHSDESNGHLHDSLALGYRRLDSLEKEIGLARLAIKASRRELQGMLDTLLAANLRLMAELDQCRKECQSSDSLRNRLTAEVNRTRELSAALKEAQLSNDALTATQKKLTLLQAVHTIRALFVMDNYLNSPLSQKDSLIDVASAKKMVVKNFDVCAVALGWKERYCDISGIVHGVRNTEHFSAIRRAGQRQSLTLESLYFLTKVENVEPRTVDKIIMRDLSMKAFSSFDREAGLSFKGLAGEFQTSGFRDFLNSKMGALSVQSAW